MSTSEVSPEAPLDKRQRVEAAIPTDVRAYPGPSGKAQRALGGALDITKSAMSMKICGKAGQSVNDLVTTADFPDITPSALMDDTILSKAEAGYARSAEYGVSTEKSGALVGAGSPRFLVSPFNPDAPVEGRTSGVAKGALAGFVPSGIPSGSGPPPSPSKYDGTGVSGQSQTRGAFETITTIIIHTSEDSIIVNLFDGKAPNIVTSFLGLATGKKKWADPYTDQPSYGKFYNGLTFHRIIKQFMIQGGCPPGTGTGGPGYEFDDEIDPSLKFDKPYLLAMAGTGLRRGADSKIHDTNGSQFFITTMPTPWLDGRHTIFGEAANDDSKRVADKPEALDADSTDRPPKPAVILSVNVAE